MIFNLGLCLCAIATAVGADDITDLGWEFLDIREMVKSNERLVVDKRTHSTHTHFRCQSALKMEDLGNLKYKYNLKARNGTAPSAPYVSGNVNVQLEEIKGKSGKYMATYTDQANTEFSLFLMNKDKDGKCFVIFVEKSNGQTGCELLVTTSALQTEIPSDCQVFYSRSCRGGSVQLYEKTCKYD
uniref:Lipocalin/cytosolic fatty-acid binding domain-containing protein n=1 Tax=Amblyomma maculatum TaxID=34609 RepID=G3MQ50_AMBMU